MGEKMILKISIIMPVYNSEKYLLEAIQSCLDQTYCNFELILIDDFSKDNSKEIIEYFQKKYINKVKSYFCKINQGAAAARNKGIELANGEYLLFADSDDIQGKHRLEKVIECFGDKKVDMVFNNCSMIDNEGKSLNRNLGFPEKLNNKNALLLSLRRNHFFVGLSAIKNSGLIRFDNTLKHSEDYDLFLRLLYNGYKFRFINESLTKYRIHSNNTSKDYKGSREATKKILGKYDMKALYIKLKTLGYEDVIIYNTFGIISLIKNKPRDAIYYMEKIKINDKINIENQMDKYFYLGVAYFTVKKIEKSYIYFKKALYLDKNRPALLNNLAVSIYYLKKGDISKAKKLLEEALSIQPGYIDAEYNLDRIKRGKEPDKITEKFLRKSLVHTL
ncbi:glycosyltransferase [Halocella sp. SP3-1]|nr:glycosyltransferase [Halocella sp. SP3-1]